MEITERLHTTSREQWREWLTENHSTKREIWISTTKSPDGLQYLDAVEEALCFGWIDSTIKAGEGVMWRRFSPRRKRSPWTELNKERCRRLERLGLMTDAGRVVLCRLDLRHLLARRKGFEKCFSSDSGFLMCLTSFLTHLAYRKSIGKPQTESLLTPIIVTTFHYNRYDFLFSG